MGWVYRLYFIDREGALYGAELPRDLARGQLSVRMLTEGKHLEGATCLSGIAGYRKFVFLTKGLGFHVCDGNLGGRPLFSWTRGEERHRLGPVALGDAHFQTVTLDDHLSLFRFDRGVCTQVHSRFPVPEVKKGEWLAQFPPQFEEGFLFVGKGFPDQQGADQSEIIAYLLGR